MRDRRICYALSVAAALSIFVALDTDAQAQRGFKTNSYDDLMHRAQDMLEDARALKCFKNDKEAAAYFDELKALNIAITDLQNSTYPAVKHHPTDWHIDRLHTVSDKIFSNLMSVPTPCPPPDTSKGVLQGPEYDLGNGGTEGPSPPPPPTPKADTAPEHSSAGTTDNGGLLAANDLAHNDWTLLGNYANFDPSAGASGDQWGGSVRGQWLVGNNLALDVGGGYNNVSTDHSNLDNWTADASVVWYLSNLRVGPTVGYQNNSVSGFHADTWNYGAFAEYFWPYVTLSGKGGGFTTSGSGPSSDGYYLGGALTGYVNPNLSVMGGVDYTHFSPFGGSDETDWTLRGTWRPWAATPFAFWAGYTYSDFSPGSFHVSTISVGVQFDLGNGQTLIESDRGGAIINQAALTALSFKF
ncbi:MAG: hypothetical protein ACTHLR_06950 [Rhizomicrobium sp.]